MHFPIVPAISTSSFGIILTTALMVTLAEMADKTQILTLALTTRHKAKFVWVGIFLGSVFSHGMAVVAGQLFQRFMQGLSDWMPLIAGCLFVFFAFWSLLEKDNEEEERAPGKTFFGPILTIAGTFFIAELGDKTQLMSLTLSASIPDTGSFVLIGAVIGMMLANGLAIVAGSFLGKKLPEELLNILAAALFFIFGVFGVWEPLSQLAGMGVTVAILVIMVVIFIAIGYMRRKRI